MKKDICFAITILIINFSVSAQAPQAIPYQAVARDTLGNLIANRQISVRFSIHDSSPTGAINYMETFTTSTNAQGLFTLSIGQGIPVSGIFNVINWGASAKFFQVELDINGGINYANMGTQQLLSVPYALYAQNVAPSQMSSTFIDDLGIMTIIYTATNAYGIAQSTNGEQALWTTQALSQPPIGSIASKDCIVLYNSTTAYAFWIKNGSLNGGTWTLQTLSGPPLGAIASGQQVIIYTASTAYAFVVESNPSASWKQQALSGTIIGGIANKSN